MITAALYLNCAYLTLVYLLTKSDGAEREPTYCTVAALLWPLFWTTAIVMRCWFAWADRKYWKNK